MPSFVESLMAPESEGDWGEYRRLILQTLQNLQESIVALDGKISALSTMRIAALEAQVAVLQFKSGLWGFAAGAIPGAAALIYAMMKHT